MTRGPGAVIGHPVVLLALMALVVNDHIFKGAMPGLLTGKLSDVAALVVAPAAAVAAIELVTRRPVHARTAWAVASATGLLLALIQVAPPVDHAYSRALGAAQWLVLDRSGPVWMVHSTRDLSDLVTVPALVVVPLLLRRPPTTGRQVSGRPSGGRMTTDR